MSFVRFILASGIAAVLASCSPRPATEIVVRVDTNLVPVTELRAFRIRVSRVGASTPITDQPYDLASGRYSFPAALGVTPRQPDDPTRVQIDVTGNLSGGGMFTTSAIVGFRAEHIVVVDMYLARECSTAGQSCPSGTTCSRGGQCVAIDRPPLPDFVADASPGADVVDASVDTATDVSMDVFSDGTIDASLDTSSDVATDAPADVATDNPADTVVEACVARCTGRECGTDGCGGSCGMCGAGSICDGSGRCVASCTPSCMGRSCGSDGCGGACGTCPSGESCNATGQCVCVADCSGRACGSDGCGGMCGSCGGGMVCNAAGACVSSCTPSCAGRTCGTDGCSGSCGSPCASGQVCDASGNCVCAPACVGRSCGTDGCGGSCGGCGAGLICNGAGQCVCAPNCAGRECGDDSCGGSCGTCGSGSVCNSSGTCVPCVAGAACTPVNECETLGQIDCSSGAPLCVGTGLAAPGTSCSGPMGSACDGNGACICVPTAGMCARCGQCNYSCTRPCM